jgi:hypothetical protein
MRIHDGGRDGFCAARLDLLKSDCTFRFVRFSRRGDPSTWRFCSLVVRGVPEFGVVAVLNQVGFESW